MVFEAEQKHTGIPLGYVVEKLRSSIETLHFAIRRSPVPVPPGQQGAEADADVAAASQRGTFMYALVSFLALHNMLGLAKDPSELSERLCAYKRNELRDWLDQVEQGGTVVD